MARAKYIYLIRRHPERRTLGAFTVKHEAVHWATINGLGPHNADLSRMRDGFHGISDKEEVDIDWPSLDSDSHGV